MSISPIMGLSSYGSISAVEPMNYAVENDADFSDVYNTESTKDTIGVNGTPPVRYPDSKINEVPYEMSPVDPFERHNKTLQVASEYNGIAEQFTSNNTSYSMAGVGASYTTAGSGFDAYA